MKKTTKVKAVAVMLAVSTTYACSHVRKDFTANLYKEKWDYKKVAGRKIATDDAKIIEANQSFIVYGIDGMPKEQMVYKGSSSLKTKVSIKKKTGLTCSSDAGVVGDDDGENVSFLISSENNVVCSFAGDAERHSEAADVTYQISKSDLSYNEVNKNQHDELIEAKAKVDAGNYDGAVVTYLNDVGVGKKYKSVLQVPANKQKGVSFDVNETDYVELSLPDGKVDAGNYKKLGPVGLTGKALTGFSKSKAQVKSLMFENEAPYSLVCSFNDASTLFNKKNTAFFGAATISKFELVGKRGVVTCFVNAPKKAYFNGHKGSFSLSVLQLKKESVKTDIDDLIANQEGIKKGLDARKDQELTTELKAIVADLKEGNAKLADRYEGVAAVFEKAQKEKAELADTIQILKQSDEDKAAQKEAVAEAANKQKEQEYRALTDKYFPKASEEKLYKLAYSFMLEPMGAGKSDGVNINYYADLKINNPIMVYINGDTQEFSFADDRFDSKVTIPTKESWHDGIGSVRYSFCARDLDSVKAQLDDLRHPIPGKVGMVSDVQKKLAKYRVQDYRQCASYVESSKESGFKRIPYEREVSYKFCWKMSKDKHADREGREEHTYIGMVPSRIQAVYRPSVSGGPVGKAFARALSAEQAKDHPFFEQKKATFHLWTFHAQDEICKPAEFWSPNLTLSGDDILGHL